MVSVFPKKRGNAAAATAGAMVVPVARDHNDNINAHTRSSPSARSHRSCMILSTGRNTTFAVFVVCMVGLGGLFQGNRSDRTTGTGTVGDLLNSLATITADTTTDVIIEAKGKEGEDQSFLDSTGIMKLGGEQKPKQQQSSPPPKKAKATIAYVISLVKCGDKQSTSAGLVDAALVMRHSIHLQSIRNPGANSRYDYKMYAIVHRDAIECSHILKQAGFTIVIKDPPIQPQEIRGSDHLRKHIHKEWCCGHDEFVKLYAYELPAGSTNPAEPIVVHVDIDFAFYQPMDDLYDAILFNKDSQEGKQARSRIPLERPNDPWPDQIDGFITRDYPQLIPGRIPGYQAGFLVARRDTTIVPQVLDVIRNEKYDGGYSRENGWGHKGYGGYVGAMAMQGLMAYFYDVVRPNTTMELNSCRFNHMGMDNLYRAHPNFKKNSPYVGKCRSTGKLDCEDCTITNLTDIYNVHYTQCRKPWNCVALGIDGGAKGQAIDTTTGKLDHCLELTKKWHLTRQDMETKLLQLTGDKQIHNGTLGIYRQDLFLGHCQGEGKGQYLQLQGNNDTFTQIPFLYADDEQPTG